MFRIKTGVAETATRQSIRAKNAGKTTIALKLAALSAAAIISVSSSVFAADRSSLYPEGSIFLSPPTGEPNAARQSPAVRSEARISPLNPLDAPAAGNVWKPSNRDAGNLSAERWQEYLDKVAEQRRGQ